MCIRDRLVGRLVFQSGIEGKGGLGIALHIGLVGSELGLDVYKRQWLHHTKKAS